MSTGNRQPTVEVMDPETGYELATYAPTTIQQSDWGVSDVDMVQAWFALRDAWLALPKGKNRTNSPATLRAYTGASMEWLKFIGANGVRPWEATSQHVRAWIAWLQASGAAPATVNQKVSAVSSFYSFVIREKHLVNGAEVSAFMDARGNTRDNPFKVGNVQRPHVDPYDKAHPLAPEDVQRLLEHLKAHSHTLTGARNFALIWAHAMTGSRASEICRLRWGDIRPSRNQRATYVFAWAGKGDKKESTIMPQPIYEAIVAYLKKAGRILPGHEADIQDDEFIFRPVNITGLKNLPGLKDIDYSKEHITPRTVQRIFQAALKAAGVKDWKKYRVHDLRHSFAMVHYAEFKDIQALRGLLHHSNIQTTDIYVRHLQDPVDAHSQGIMKQYGFFG